MLHTSGTKLLSFFSVGRNCCGSERLPFVQYQSSSFLSNSFIAYNDLPLLPFTMMILAADNLLRVLLPQWNGNPKTLYTELGVPAAALTRFLQLSSNPCRPQESSRVLGSLIHIPTGATLLQSLSDCRDLVLKDDYVYVVDSTIEIYAESGMQARQHVLDQFSCVIFIDILALLVALPDVWRLPRGEHLSSACARLENSCQLRLLLSGRSLATSRSLQI